MNFQDYFQAHNNYFWQWEDNTEVLAIPNGSTIAYKQHVIEVLDGISDDGIPPFGALLLVMIAINDTTDDCIAFVEKTLTDHLLQMNFQANTSRYVDAFSFLKSLQEIPPTYKSGRKKIILLKSIFKDSHRKINAKTGKGLVLKLKDKEFANRKLMDKPEFNDRVYDKDVNVLRLLWKRFPTVQSIIDAMADLPDLADEELPNMVTESASQQTYKDFVEELMDNDQTFKVGALIKPIWAGFKIPVFNASPSEQPLGGFSDISNKGDFDKLLVSEFANDDLVFMSRLANNEALYLHREMPPATDDLQRIILLDISLRMWGTPKTLAHAVYLAVAKHPKSAGNSQAFVVGNFYQPIDYNNISDVIDGLQKVSIGLHAGEGLLSFFNEYKNSKELEIFYITTKDAMKYPAVQKQMAENVKAFKYIITVDQEAEIIFYRNKNNAHKHLQTIRLPLGKLWKKPEKEIARIAENPISETEVIKYPLLFMVTEKVQTMLPFDEEYIYCVVDRYLFKRNTTDNLRDIKNNKGWQLVLSKLPKSGLFEIGNVQNGDVHFLSFNPQNRELVIIDLETLKGDKIIFDKWKSNQNRGFIFMGNSFMHLHVNPNAYFLKLENDKVSFQKETVNSYTYQEYKIRQETIASTAPNSNNIKSLKKLSKVFINAPSNLCFNTFELRLNDFKEYVLKDSGREVWSGIRYEAKKVDNSATFQFKDGSIVKMDGAGVITLQSSNKEIPTIYIPTVLNYPLGVATQENFAGNLFFHNEKASLIKVTLDSTGIKQGYVIKIIRDNVSDLGLQQVRDIVDNAPKVISRKMKMADAIKLKNELAEVGATASIADNKDYQLQKIIRVSEFQEKYLLPFIHHIAHATKY